MCEHRIHAWHRNNAESRNLETIPGIGPIIASALVASVADPSIFKSGREMAAWALLWPGAEPTGRQFKPKAGKATILAG